MIVELAVGLMLLNAVPHETYVLRTDTSVWDVAVEDLSGDGRAEILLVCCEAETRPFVKFVARYQGSSQPRIHFATTRVSMTSSSR